MSIFANAEHRISAYRTYFRIAKANQDLFRECKQTRVARKANVGEEELTRAFETIERKRLGNTPRTAAAAAS